MATVRHDGRDRWVVHLAAQRKSEVTIEVHMSRETAEKIAARETARLQALNPGCDLAPEDVGTAVLHVLSLYAIDQSL